MRLPFSAFGNAQFWLRRASQRYFCNKAQDHAKFNLQAYKDYFVHGGNCIVLLAIVQTDMIPLRSLMIVASTAGIAYNLLQPKPLIPPALWGGFFICCHAYQLSILLRERQKIQLSQDEEQAYEAAFLPFGFTPRQFLDILEHSSGKWCDFQKGEYVHHAGSLKEDVHYLLEGEVEMLDENDSEMAKLDPGKGGWLGTLFDPNAGKEQEQHERHDSDSKHSLSARCMTDRCRTLGLRREPLHRILKENPRLSQAATKAEVADLWGKIQRATPEHVRTTYRAMLEVAAIDGVIHANEKHLLESFRQRHGLSEEDHAKCVQELGWKSDKLQEDHGVKSLLLFFRK
eukprot:gnl/MRDRNA2_/MRDRNA2_132012_c0_seq1.p1 gnl/MRDRNA2_/MRDRNA2_132012_c0~~gnl/MRDRNA2_/MRDRNA2_132012_c0_seq1.p1  ORF type:complete len:343 (-),score=73.78 gnl/MRDRNA2_/MRDRNA2_132012_c0_seq1:192-1220(-)